MHEKTKLSLASIYLCVSSARVLPQRWKHMRHRRSPQFQIIISCSNLCISNQNLRSNIDSTTGIQQKQVIVFALHLISVAVLVCGP